MNAASTPEFRQILRDLVTEGYRGGSSGGMLKEAWKRYRSTYGNKKGLKRTKCKICRRLHAPGEVKHAFNPRRKKAKGTCKYCGGIMSGKVCLNCLKNPKRSKKNPIAIYNPPSGKPLPMSLIEMRYRRTGGEYSGELFKHRFKDRPKVYGMPDGSLLIKGSTRLWGEAT